MHLLSPSIIASGFEENKILRTARLLRKIDDTKASNIIWEAVSNRTEEDYIRDVCDINGGNPSHHPQPQPLNDVVDDDDEILPHPMAWQGSWVASSEDDHGVEV